MRKDNYILINLPISLIEIKYGITHYKRIIYVIWMYGIVPNLGHVIQTNERNLISLEQCWSTFWARACPCFRLINFFSGPSNGELYSLGSKRIFTEETFRPMLDGQRIWRSEGVTFLCKLNLESFYDHRLYGFSLA